MQLHTPSIGLFARSFVEVHSPGNSNLTWDSVTVGYLGLPNCVTSSNIGAMLSAHSWDNEDGRGGYNDKTADSRE
jgi:hypothetical protein